MAITMAVNERYDAAYLVNGSAALCTILNSEIAAWCLSRISPSIRGGYLRMIDSTAGRLPVPRLEKGQLAELENIAIAANQEASTDDQSANVRVADYYGLSRSEFNAVHRWYIEKQSGADGNDAKADSDDSLL